MTEFLRELRNNFIFKIIPMLNVDGVVLGNNRTSVSGNDLNRKYKDADELLHPEIFALK
jgi:murein tripeptide amidase MpaA